LSRCAAARESPRRREVFEDARAWIADHGIFEGGNLGARNYEQSVLTLAE